MPKYHPDIHMLTEFAAGALCDAHRVCVAAHLEHCRECRVAVMQLNQVGGILLDQSCDAGDVVCDPGIQLEEDALAKAFAAIDRAEAALEQAAPSGNELGNLDLANDGQHQPKPGSRNLGNPNLGNPNLGNNVSQLLAHDQEFRWEKISSALSIGRIRMDDSEREVALHKLEPGGKVGNHDHKGREITVVLTGSFSDQDGLYLPGDFLVRDSGESHQPMASHDSSCVCLSVLEAPVKFTGRLTRLINPFLRLKPRAA